MKKFLTIAMCVIIVGLVINQMFNKDIWDENRELLKENVLATEATEEPVSLSSLTPFDWDRVYSIDPYASKEEIYDVVGYKWDTVEQTLSEGMNQLVFMKEDKVVCYVYGYPENNGFGIYFEGTETEGRATVLHKEDDVLFKRHTFDDTIVYMQVE